MTWFGKSRKRKKREAGKKRNGERLKEKERKSKEL